MATLQQQQLIGPTGSLLPVQMQCRQQRITTAYTVVIVDMQTGYSAAGNDMLQARVVRLIEHARASNWPVVVLSVKGKGETVTRIADSLRGYGLAEPMEKETTSGSQKVLEACEKRGFGIGKFLVCGVNTGACVLGTVKGLAFSPGRPMVATLMDACGDDTPGDWYVFPEVSNVSLIPALDLL